MKGESFDERKADQVELSVSDGIDGSAGSSVDESKANANASESASASGTEWRDGFFRPMRSVSIRRSNPDAPIESAPDLVSRSAGLPDPDWGSARMGNAGKKGLRPRTHFMVFLAILTIVFVCTMGPQLMSLGLIMLTGLHAQQPQQVVRDYDMAIALVPNNAELYLARANIKHVIRDFKGAMDDYGLSIKTDPNFAMAWMNRAICEETQGLHEAALKDYNKSLEINPNIAVTYNNRALLYEKQGRKKEALADFASAIKLNPERPLFYRNRANLLYETGDYWQAEKDLTTCINLSPNSAGAYKLRARCYEKLGKKDLAARDAAEYARLRR